MSSEKIRSPLIPSRFPLYVVGTAVLVAGALGALWPNLKRLFPDVYREQAVSVAATQ